MSYTYEFSARYWVDPDTGVLIDINKNDVRKAIVSVPGLPIAIDPVVVYNLNYSPTEESLADAVKDAEDYGNQLDARTHHRPHCVVAAGSAAGRRRGVLCSCAGPRTTRSRSPHHR